MSGFVVKSKLGVGIGFHGRMINLLFSGSSNVVNRFGRSSYYVGRHILSQGKTIEEKYYVSTLDIYIYIKGHEAWACSSIFII